MRGYVQGKLPQQEIRLPQLHNTLTVEWSEAIDPLEDEADRLQIRLPDSRISVLSLLCVLFDYKHPAVPTEISSLRARLGNAKKDFTVSENVTDDGRTSSEHSSLLKA